MRNFILLLVLLITYTAISAQGVDAITNINYYGGDGFAPHEITVYNNSLFFYGTTLGDSFYNNLFISDGTPGSATMVKRINTGYGYNMGGLTVLNNKLIFADTYNYTGQLWSSDGTAAGTVPVKPLITGKKFVLL